MQFIKWHNEEARDKRVWESLHAQVEAEVKAIEAERLAMQDRGTMYTGQSPNVNVSYPYSDTYEFKTKLEIINFDDERKKDILTGNGFIVSPYTTIQRELKAEKGIFSSDFGQTLADMNPYIDRYKCACGNLKSRLYNGIVCPVCNQPVKYVDDNYSYFGWIVLNKYSIIHPTLYKSLEFLIGPQRLINILDKIENKNEDGKTIIEELEEEFQGKKKKKKKGPYRKEQKDHEPYYGAGILYFQEHIKEICDYYLSIASNKQNKQPYYDNIMENINNLFTHSIPVFTTHLRPFDASEKNKFAYEPTNALYTMISKLVTLINGNEGLRMYRRHTKSKEQLLFQLQNQFNALYDEIDKILSGKKGNVRLLAGGRFNFSSRDVIVQNPDLYIDQITLPYWCLVDILQQQIINILTKTYNISYADAYQKWYKANINPDKVVIEIINGLIKTSCEGQGLPFIINRNPSIARGSLLQMHCVDMTMTYTMALPLTILPLLAADFDGDVLNVYYIINQAFYQRSFEVLNPRNSMYISNNDGMLNTQVMPARDTLINANTLLRFGRGNYTEEQLAKIQAIMSKKS